METLTIKPSIGKLFLQGAFVYVFLLLGPFLYWLSKIQWSLVPSLDKGMYVAFWGIFLGIMGYQVFRYLLQALFAQLTFDGTRITYKTIGQKKDISLNEICDGAFFLGEDRESRGRRLLDTLHLARRDHSGIIRWTISTGWKRTDIAKFLNSIRTQLRTQGIKTFSFFEESHLATRPLKTAFPLKEQLRLRDIALDKIRNLLLPNTGIQKILLIGSSVKGSFGSYASPGFRGSLFSDFDFIVYVKDDYLIPSFLEREPDGKPFSKQELNLAYRIKPFIEQTYDAEVFFVKQASLLDLATCEEGERAGIPMKTNSMHPHIVVFEAR